MFLVHDTVQGINGVVHYLNMKMKENRSRQLTYNIAVNSNERVRRKRGRLGLGPVIWTSCHVTSVCKFFFKPQTKVTSSSGINIFGLFILYVVSLLMFTVLYLSDNTLLLCCTWAILIILLVVSWSHIWRIELVIICMFDLDK